MLPKRGNVRPVFQLYSAAYAATAFSTVLDEIFEITGRKDAARSATHAELSDVCSYMSL